jgi:Yip1 domain
MNGGPPMNNLQIAVALATAPSTAFNELRERPRFWFPLLVVVLVSVAMVYWYYSFVDIEWLKDAIFSNNPKMLKMPEADRAKALAMMGRGAMLWGSVISALILIPLFFVLNALYCLLAAKVTKLPQGFKHWFSLTCWTALPLVLGAIVGAILLLMSSSPQVAPGILQPLSIDELITHLPIGSPAQGLLDSLGIPGFLSWGLMVSGVHSWSQRSWLFSLIFTFIPIVLIYGIWAAIAFT